MKRLLIVVFILWSLTSVNAALIETSPIGETYPIIEVDLIEFIQSKAMGIDKLLQELVEKNFKPSFNKLVTPEYKLPFAPKDDIRRYKPMHKTEYEIFTIDKNGIKTVIYPKGFIYNPLEYTKLNEQYYVINGKRPAEIDWLKKQNLAGGMVIITEGNAIELMESTGVRLYVLSEIVKEKLYIKHTPSKVKQEGSELVVYEYFLNDKEAQ